MLKKVQLHLSFFCSLIVGAVLSIMTIFCLFIFENNLRNRDRSDFLINTDSILTSIDNQSVLSHTWLSQMEHNYNLKIDILDGSVPLLYSELRARGDYEALFAQARDKAVNEYGLTPARARSGGRLQQQSFSVPGPGKANYLAVAAMIPKNGSYLDVILLHPEDSLNAQIHSQRVLFGCGAFGSWIALTVLAAFFVYRMLRPIEENHRRQVEFVAAASHELRSPLTVILSSLSALRGALKDGDAAQAQRFTENIESEGQRMKRLIRDMLTLANSDSASLSIRKTDVELDTLLLDSYEKFEPLAQKKNLKIAVSLPEERIFPCSCDKERVSQILSVLIDNAIAYTPAGGHIQLALAFHGKAEPALSAASAESAAHFAPRGFFELSVADNGPGVPDEQKRQIFERFYRADDAHKDKEHFGLGLCIAMEIAGLHRGTILVKDTEGGGATFVLRLPVS